MFERVSAPVGGAIVRPVTSLMVTLMLASAAPAQTAQPGPLPAPSGAIVRREAEEEEEEKKVLQ